MKYFFSFLLILLAVPAWFVPSAAAVEQAARPVFLVPVAGDVDPGLAAFVKRAVEQAAEDQEALFVFELDTFGGRVDSALQIVDTLLTLEPERSIAFVRTKAISAGALIALASGRLAMRPHTTIGDCAPIIFSQEGPQMMGEKFQSPLRAKFRTLARRNNYPEALAEAMVTAEMEVYRLERDGKKIYLDEQGFADLPEAERAAFSPKQTVVAKGELLTMDDVEAADLGFSRFTADSVEEVLERLDIGHYRLVRVEQTWSENAGRFIGSIAPILLMIGMAAVYIELKSPGFGVPGALGLALLALVFFNQYLVGLAAYTELLFILIGLMLLAVEYFVLPGFGVAGIAGFLFLAAGMILSFQDFTLPDPQIPWQRDLFLRNTIQTLGALLAAFAASLAFMRFVFPHLGRVLEGPYLAATLAGSRATPDDLLGLRTGDTGTAVTALRPAGKMRRGDELFDVVADGGFLEKGDPLVVLEVRGMRVVVGRREES